VAKKKFYQKPKIKRVKLAPEEAVLTACKTTFGGPSGSAGERTKCVDQSTCQALGS